MRLRILRQLPLLAGCLIAMVSHSPAISQAIFKSDTDIRKIFTNLEDKWVQHKVYVQTDKRSYFAGEKIWYKAYLVDALKTTPLKGETNLMVELTNTDGKKVSYQILKSIDGMAHGDISIPDSIPADTYFLRAYTPWMLATSPTLIFSTELTIYNPQEPTFIKKSVAKNNQRNNKSFADLPPDVLLTIHPEGGRLVAEIENKIVLRTSRPGGQPVSATVRLTDNSGQQLRTITIDQHGFASFQLVPKTNVTYNLELISDGFVPAKFSLPRIFPEGYVMQVMNLSNEISVRLASNIRDAAIPNQSTLFLLAHTRGKLNYLNEIKLTDGSGEFSIPIASCAPGVNMISLVNSEGLLVAERLIYVAAIPAVLSTQAGFGQDENGGFVNLSVRNNKATSFDGPFSISVTSVPDFRQLVRDNIVSTLLLTSDINLNIGGVATLLTEQNAPVLDMVMIASTYPRFYLQDILLQKSPFRAYSQESGLSLIGSVTPGGSKMPVGDVMLETSITAGESPVKKIAKTRADGKFRLTGLDFNGMAKAEVTIQSDDRGRQLQVQLDNDFPLLPAPKPGLYFLPVRTEAVAKDWVKRKEPNIFITPAPIQKIEEPAGRWGRADVVIRMSEMGDRFQYMIDLLRARVPGLIIEGDRIMMRGPTSINLSNEPLFLVDDAIVGKNSFLTINMYEVDRLEVIKGANTASFGVMGSNGAILAYTKKGVQQIQRKFDFIIHGYSVPTDFMTHFLNIPAISTEDPKHIKTYYWNPQVSFDEKAEAKITFPITPADRELLIIMEGVDEQGRVAHRRVSLKL